MARSGYGTSRLAHRADTMELGYIDPSIGTPEQQYATLVGMLEAADAKSPAPQSGSSYEESIPEDEYINDTVLNSEYLPPADLEVQAEADIGDVISGAPTSEFPHPYWENDDQYHGLGVPPGVPNYGQPIETGHSQINLPNPGSEVGTFAWSGAITLARVARHENGFKSYQKGCNRGHGVRPEKFTVPYVLRTQQGRDMLLIALKKRGLHNKVVDDVPAQTYNEQVLTIDPYAYQTMGNGEIGAEGVLP